MSTNIYDFSIESDSHATASRLGGGSGALGSGLVYRIEASSPNFHTRELPHVTLEFDSPNPELRSALLATYASRLSISGLYQLVADLIVHHANDSLEGEVENTPITPFASISDEINRIAAAFSLSATKGARVFSTSRQTFYSWRNGQPVRRAEFFERIKILRDLAAQWNRLSSLPVGEGLEHRDTITGYSLLDLLTAASLDQEALRTHLCRLHAHLSSAWAAADVLLTQNKNDGWAAAPEQAREIINASVFREGSR